MIDISLSNKFRNMAFVCAVLIVFLHFPGGRWFRTVMSAGVSQIAVPYFFLSAGYFCVSHAGEREWWRAAMRKRVGSLLVPNLIHGFLFASIIWAVHEIGVVMGRSAGDFDVSVRWFLQCCLLGIWFLRVLFVLAALSFVLHWIVSISRRFGFVFLLLLFALWQIWDCTVLQSLPGAFHLDFSLRNLFYISLGICLFCWFDLSCVLRVRLVFLPMLVIAWFAYRSFAGKSLIISSGIANLGVFGMLISVWFLVPTCSWPRFLTRNTLPIFLLHVIFLPAILGGYKVFKLMPHVDNPSWYVAQVFVVIGLIVLLSEGMRKWFPGFFRIAYGGR